MKITRSCAPMDGERALLERVLRSLRHGGVVRQQKVIQIRRDVRSGGYENELKLTIAVERLIPLLR